jgi:putative glutamine amidotransferase
MGENFKVLVTGEENISSFDGSPNHVVRRHWAEQLDAVGILALTPLDPREAAAYAQLADGLLLSDGAPVHRARFGGYYTDFQDMLATSRRRDEFEFALLEQFLILGKPVLGLGRGASVLDAAGYPQGTQNIFVATDEDSERARDCFNDFVGAVCDSPHRRAAALSAASDSRITVDIQRHPRILIAGAPAYDQLRLEPSVLISHDCAAAITQVGGIALLAFPLIDRADAYAAVADALVLTGTSMFTPTPDLLPQLLAEEEPVRNRFDEAIYAAFRRVGKPVLGICLGHQMINRYEGGSLKHDFKLQDGVEHMGTAHTVSVKPGSVLHQLFGEELCVNSRHNDRVDQVAPTLDPVAFSPDGVVEALEHSYLPIISVQWHPELSRGDLPEPYDATDPAPLFRHFVELAANHSSPLSRAVSEREQGGADRCPAVDIRCGGAVLDVAVGIGGADRTEEEKRSCFLT